MTVKNPYLVQAERLNRTPYNLFYNFCRHHYSKILGLPRSFDQANLSQCLEPLISYIAQLDPLYRGAYEELHLFAKEYCRKITIIQNLQELQIPGWNYTDQIISFSDLSAYLADGKDMVLVRPGTLDIPDYAPWKLLLYLSSIRDNSDYPYTFYSASRQDKEFHFNFRPVYLGTDDIDAAIIWPKLTQPCYNPGASTLPIYHFIRSEQNGHTPQQQY